MKFSPLASVIATTTLLTSALADFHIGYRTNTIFAVASNQYTCDVWQGFSKGANGKTDLSGSFLPNFFSVKPWGKRFCQVSTLNFYKDQNSDKFTGLIAGGDGNAVATCYPGSHYYSRINGNPDLHCGEDQNGGQIDVYDYLICYSWICN